MATVEEKLSQYIVDTRYEDLSKDAIEYCKKSILDMMGSVIGGSAEVGASSAMGRLSQCFLTSECSISNRIARFEV